MSDETGDEGFEGLDEASWPGAVDDDGERVDEITRGPPGCYRGDGHRPRCPRAIWFAPPAATCRPGPSTVTVARGWWSAGSCGTSQKEASRARIARSSRWTSLNEALGPLLLALGFPIGPYAVDGGWIVTGPRS